MIGEAKNGDIFVEADGFVLLYLSSLRFKCRNTVRASNHNEHRSEEEKKETSNEIKEL